jgi:hypothetical protein
LLVQWYRSGGKSGKPLDGQAIIELAFELGKMPDEITRCDQTWVNKMLAARAARIEANKKSNG